MPNLTTNPKTQEDFKDLNVLILCGGQGTRLASVIGATPKSLAQIKEKTFLDILIEKILEAGFKKITLCVGHLKDQIKNKYKNFPEISISEESSPLGTGGAVKNAEAFVGSGNFLVMNGDSIFQGLDLEKFYQFHKENSGLISIALAPPRSDKDFGGVTLAKDNRIINFNEKNNLDSTHLMNGGVYFMKKEAFSHMPSNPFSLESDFFPNFASRSLYGFFSEGKVIDIGTPERYSLASRELS